MSIATKCVPSSRRAILSTITAHSASPVSATVSSFHQTARSQLHPSPYRQPAQAGGSKCPAWLKRDCAPACARWSPDRHCSDKAPMLVYAAMRVG